MKADSKPVKLDLELGIKLSLKPERSMETSPDLELTTVLEELTDDGHLVIQAPIYRNVLYSLHPGEALFFHFFDKNGRLDFQAIVVEQVKIGELYYVKAKVISDLSRTQRRDFFRVQTTINGMVSFQREGYDETQEFKCVCYDISGSGAALRMHDVSFAIEDEVVVSLPVGAEGREEKFPSSVRWCANIDSDTHNFRMGVQFSFVSETQRRLVIQYVMQCQRDMLARMRSWQKGE